MEKIGFIGVGMMGGGIARRMIEHGVPVLAYDRDANALQDMLRHGADVASSVREIVDQTEFVFACLPTADVSRAVALGPGGVAGGTKVKIYIETSTLGSTVAAELADALEQHGIIMLAPPSSAAPSQSDRVRLVS